MKGRHLFALLVLGFAFACIADASNFFGRGGQVDVIGCGTSCGIHVAIDGGGP